MEHLATIMMALDLLHVPSRAKPMRSVPLPDGTVTLLRIASGDDQLARQAGAAAGSSSAIVREAAGFFIEQTMLYPGADSYRVLGARPEASSSELRRNMALLLRWLHPDHGPGGRSVFAPRVTRAWNDLKNEERRADYDRSRRMSLTEKSLNFQKGRANSNGHTSNRRLRPSHPRAKAYRHKAEQPSGLWRKMLLLLLGREIY